MTTRQLSIDRQGAEWAYYLGYWYRDHECPFRPDSPHWVYWLVGAVGGQFEYPA